MGVDDTDDAGPSALVEVGGARRRVNTALLQDEGLGVGDWVLIHVGFALARLDEDEALATLRDLASLETVYADELDAMARSATSSGAATGAAGAAGAPAGAAATARPATPGTRPGAAEGREGPG